MSHFSHEEKLYLSLTMFASQRSLIELYKSLWHVLLYLLKRLRQEHFGGEWRPFFVNSTIDIRADWMDKVLKRYKNKDGRTLTKKLFQGLVVGNWARLKEVKETKEIFSDAELGIMLSDLRGRVLSSYALTSY